MYILFRMFSSNFRIMHTRTQENLILILYGAFSHRFPHLGLWKQGKEVVNLHSWILVVVWFCISFSHLFKWVTRSIVHFEATLSYVVSIRLVKTTSSWPSTRMCYVRIRFNKQTRMQPTHPNYLMSRGHPLG